MATLNSATDAVPAWEAALERVHDLLGQVCSLLETVTNPPIDLTPAATILQAAFKELYTAWAWREDPLGHAQRLGQHLVSTSEALRPGAAEAAALAFAVEALESAREPMARAEECFARTPFRPSPGTTELRASSDVPRLHQLDREVVSPRVHVAPPREPEVYDAPPERPPPETPEELAAVAEEMTKRALAALDKQKAALAALPKEPEEEEIPPVPEGFHRDPLPILTETQFVEARAHELFEEVVMLANQRTPLLEEPWRSSLWIERRLCAAIDGLAALGGRAIQHLSELTMSSPLKDPDRLFGLTLAAGCIEGRDTLAMAERFFMEQIIVDPAYATAFAKGLVLVPHPHVEPLARRFLTHPMELCRAVGLRVLMHRGTATSEDVENGVLDKTSVMQVALPHYAWRRDREARDAIHRGCELLEQQSDNSDLADAVWRSLALSHDGSALSTLRRAMDGPLAALAAVHYAVTGGENEARELLELARQEPTPRLFTALGWSGPMEAIPLLIGALETADEEGGIAAAHALERLTAAGLKEEAEIAPEAQLDPEIREPDIGEEPEPEPLARILSDPRDLPEEGSPDVLERPSTDAERWHAYWKKHQPRYQAGLRYRRGLPYCAPIVLGELDTGPCVPAERRMLHHELMYRTARNLHFSPHDFVRVQEESLRQWEPIATRYPGQPGTWSMTYRRG